MLIPGYRVSAKLRSAGRCVTYRGSREEDHTPVIIKALAEEFPSPADIDSLMREYQTMKDLEAEGVAKVYSLERHHGNLALVIEDIGGEPLNKYIGSGELDLATFLSISIKLSTAIAELHRRNIVHKDINPQNIAVNLETRQVKLFDFSLAAQLSPESAEMRRPGLLEGTPAYMSPEQTGRMNRAIDYRSDFYSMGVTFYELLTGRLPFFSHDHLELIHSHIAKIPIAPCELNSEVPQPVSDIVMKLLAKNAEERYQSALGLKEDLKHCAREWAANRRIASFPLAQRDISDRFLISQKLYGRKREVEEMLVAFDRVCQGRAAPSSMMLVAGYSGIGKTSLIQELYKPIVRERGYFISGKFDQVARGVPFGALIQAFHGLVRQLLTESEERLALWRSRLSNVLGANGGVLAEVIPEIELIIGKQPPPPALGPTEALNRFQLVFQNFVAALARQEHPLVVFLDDLQWVDAATLSLLEPLLTSQEIQHLFLMGAYRDNEVDETHPLMRTLAALESAGIELQRVALGPLQLADLTQLVRDTLHGEMSDAEPLAQLVLEKTGGNPFFVTQFLKTLKQEGYLEFDHARGRWIYRIEAIAAAPLTDNVIDLMTRKIQRLSAKTQRALTLAACIGNPFDQHTLAIVSEQSREAAADDLKQAINEGLILPAARRYDAAENRASETHAPAYSFLHDRVQQSAYALIPAERKQIVHLTVGRLLRSSTAPDHTEERDFDIVHHLNLGRGLIADDAERIGLARLNLSAGQKAKSSTAHEAALDYLQAGLSLLTEEQWASSDYDLAFGLHLEAAECQYLCGNFDKAEREFELLLQRAATSLDKARALRLRSVQYENMARYADALASAREGLALFGVSFPDAKEEKQAALENEIAAIQSLLGQRSIASLVDLPVMTDPEMRMVMNILTDIWSSAYILGDPVLARLISATMVRLSLVHGNVEESAYGYVTHAITVGPVLEDYQSAYEFGKLALRVNERFNDSRRRAKIHQQFHAHVNLWRQPMQTCIPYAREACRSGLETGDFLYAAYGACTETWPAILATQDLEQFVRDYAPNVALIRKLKNAGFADSLKIILNWVRALQGKTRAPLSLSDESIDENEYMEIYRGNPFFTTFHSVARLHLCYMFGEYEKALQAARVARTTVYQLAGTIWPVLFEFWNGLTLAANYIDAKEDKRRAYLVEMRNAQKSLAVLAENCPENFFCQSLLLSAEIERVAGDQLSAADLYDRAIRYAVESSMLQHQAQANELCAKFWLGRGHEKTAAVFMAEARDCYAQWGAAAKVEELEHKYSDLLGRVANRDSHLSAEGGVAVAQAFSKTDAGALDTFSVMKAAQAIAGEVELEQLLARLMRIAIENAGAERGSLLLEHVGELFVHAEGSLHSAAVKVHGGIPLVEAQNLPASIVNYVRRTLENVVLADAQSDDRYGSDPYIARHIPRSVMCIPALNQGRLIGVLYLENNMVSGAFTPDRIQIMQVLSTQAAISLENARLFDGLKQEIVERKRAEQQILEQAMLLDKAHDAIGVRDLEDRIIYWNKGAEQLFGWKAEEILGKRAPDILYNDPALSDELARTVRETGSWSGELRLRTKSDAEVIVYSRWTLVRGADGEAKSILMISTDITEKKRMEESFLRAQRMESIGTLAGGMAHDLNNVLTPIMLAVETLQANLKNKRHRQMLDMIQANAKRGADMAAQVLAFARGVESERARLDPRHLIAEMAKIARETFPRSIDTQTKTERKLWAISGNVTQMHQVMLNLMLNARDAMPDGGTLTLGAENVVLDKKDFRVPPDATGPHVVLSVRDTGRGIPPDIIDKVFDPFFTTKEIGRGTGLGLSTVAGIVKSHGGFVNVQSEPGKGAEFRVYLPALPSSEKPQGAKKREAPRGNGELILVVDDESPIREVAKATLEANGYRVITAADGTEALALYAKQSHQVQAVLTDLMMPYMDGGATIRALEKMNPQVKIIVSSGLPANPRAAGAKNLRAKAFMAKPYTVSTLLTTLHNVLKRK